MKFVLALFLSVSVSYYLGHVLPWWVIAPIMALISGFLRMGVLEAFIAGFIGIGSLWLSLAWMVYLDAHSDLPQKMTVLFDLSDPLYLAILTGVIGGMIGGLGAITGSLFYHAYRHPLRNRRGPYF